MAFEERNFSFGACEREFEAKNEASTSSDDLNNLLTCQDSHFETQISRMKTVDLDMAVIIFEEQIKIGREMGQGKHSGKKELNQLRERLTRCFMRRAELVRGGGRPFEGEKYTSKTSRSISLTDAERTTDVDSVDDVSSLSISELKSLLVHNGIDFDENATKESLETVVKCEILQIEDGELDDWEPPGDNDIQWKSPKSFCLKEKSGVGMIDDKIQGNTAMNDG
eukprot:Seg1551.3 transcript_id=Seg1551.3/GoldUCD/mRNA.D3Y31 product="hypothetical protein" protein_id=Seg1551.3/GoldUCD/D3Y31